MWCSHNTCCFSFRDPGVRGVDYGLVETVDGKTIDNALLVTLAGHNPTLVAQIGERLPIARVDETVWVPVVTEGGYR